VASTFAAILPSASDGDLPLLRVAVEMSWGPLETGAKDVSVLESIVTQILAGRPAVFLCMYDLELFGTGTLVNALRIHSKVLLDGTVLDNPQFLVPRNDPETLPDAVERDPLVRLCSGRPDGGDRWLLLTGAEVRIAGLVATGMTNRAMAKALIVSPHTVDAHLKHMYAKLDIHSRVELTLLALQHGPPAA
jgi:DNA-binding CsgD family transcriptional regulator